MGTYHRSSVKYSFLYGTVVIATILADQGSKAGSLATINSGIAFGWGEGRILPGLMSFLVIFLLLLTAYVWRKHWSTMWWSHALFAGAASGNLLDRWWHGGVRDPWVIPVFNLHNNLADWILVLVALYWVWYLYANERTISDHPNPV